MPYAIESPVMVISGATTSELFQHVVTAGEIAAKGYQLAPVPADPTRVTVDLIGTGPKYFGVDFTVDTLGFLSWSGLAMDGHIYDGDVLRVQYSA